MGILILDSCWSVPKASTLFKRSIAITTVGYALFLKALLVDGNYMILFEWEKAKFHTQVIDKKLFAKLHKEFDECDDMCDNMTQKYNEYLRELYSK